MIIPKTQLQSDLIGIDEQATRAASALRHVISELNRSYEAAGSLPDPRLAAVLEPLIANGLLESVFAKHAVAAAGLNLIAEAVGVPDRAVEVAGRKFSVSPEGKVTLAPKETEQMPTPMEESFE